MMAGGSDVGHLALAAETIGTLARTLHER